MANLYGPQIVTSGLILSLDPGDKNSYPGSGTTINDLSGNGYTGTLVNGLSYSTLNLGSFNFDGTNDYISVPMSGQTTLTGYTVAHWCKRDAENRMHIGTSNNTFYWYGDNSWRYVHGGAGGELYYTKTVSIPVETWGYYVATYDGAQVRVYRQGVFQDSQATTGTVNFSAQDWTFGQFSSSATYAFLGLGGFVNIYNRALSASEIEQNYLAQKSRFGL